MNDTNRDSTSEWPTSWPSDRRVHCVGMSWRSASQQWYSLVVKEYRDAGFLPHPHGPQPLPNQRQDLQEICPDYLRRSQIGRSTLLWEAILTIPAVPAKTAVYV